MRVKVPFFADTSLAQENIVYQFSTDGITWTNITTTATGSDGVAETSYKPAQIGSLLIRASFNGDTSYYSSVSDAETILVNNARQIKLFHGCW